MGAPSDRRSASIDVTVHHQPRLINTDTDSEAEYGAQRAVRARAPDAMETRRRQVPHGPAQVRGSPANTRDSTSLRSSWKSVARTGRSLRSGRDTAKRPTPIAAPLPGRLTASRGVNIKLSGRILSRGGGLRAKRIVRRGGTSASDAAQRSAARSGGGSIQPTDRNSHRNTRESRS